MGFPTRISRAALGKRKVDTRRVRDTAKEAGAAEVNLAWWTLAGCANVVPQAWLLATFTGPSTIVVTAHREAWSPNADQAAPTISRTSAGLYVVTYLTSYPDETGAAVSTKLYAATPTPQSLTALRGVALVTANRVVTVSIFDSAEAAADGSFLLTVW